MKKRSNQIEFWVSEFHSKKLVRQIGMILKYVSYYLKIKHFSIYYFWPARFYKGLFFEFKTIIFKLKKCQK